MYLYLMTPLWYCVWFLPQLLLRGGRSFVCLLRWSPFISPSRALPRGRANTPPQSQRRHGERDRQQKKHGMKKKLDCPL